jgi:hypothetical protein
MGLLAALLDWKSLQFGLNDTEIDVLGPGIAARGRWRSSGMGVVSCQTMVDERLR